MTLPLVLIIDDQYGWDAALRRKVLKEAGFLGGEGVTENNAIAEAVFCPGQARTDTEIENDYDVIRQAIEGTPGTNTEWALILLDARFDSGKINHGVPVGLSGDDSFGITVRTRLMAEFPGLPIVMLTSKHESELSGKQYPYLSKTGMTPRIFSQCLIKHGRLTLEQQRSLLGLNAGIVVSSPLSFKLFHEVNGVADNLPVLILGESGSGKEVLAQYIHNRSDRKDGPFVAINVSAIPSELVESLLFGIEPRVASGVAGRIGKFESANGGTLFLDEIGDMPLALQAKLLRVLQEKEVLRVGGEHPIPINVRVLSATSRDIGDLLAQGKLREDLLRRIDGAHFTVLPLRERPEDILPLAEAFLKNFSAEYNKTGIVLGDDAKAGLCKHPFFGNVGELEHIIHRLVGTAGNNRVISGIEMEEALATSMSEFARTSELFEQASPAMPSAEAATNAARSLSPSINSLNDLLAAIKKFQVAKDDPELAGARGKIDDALHILLKKLAGAALEACRDPNTKKLNRQGAMRFLTGNDALKGKGPGRVINEILGKKPDEGISDDDLEGLVSYWWETPKD